MAFSGQLGGDGLGGFSLGSFGESEEQNLDAEAASNLEITDEATCFIEHTRTAEHTLALDAVAEPTFRTQVDAQDAGLLLVAIADCLFSNHVEAITALPDLNSTALASFFNNVFAASTLEIVSIGVATFRNRVDCTSLLTLDHEAVAVFQSRNRGISNLTITVEAEPTFRSTNEIIDPLFLTATAVCVFHNNFSEASSLNITQSATKILKSPYVPIVEHTLSLSAIAGVFRSIDVDGSSTLTIDDLAERGIYYRTLVHNLSFSHQAIVFRQFGVSAISALTLGAVADNNQKFKSAISTLTITDTNKVIRPWYVAGVTPITETTTVFNPDTFTVDTVILSGLNSHASAAAIAIHTATTWLEVGSHANGYRLDPDAIAADADNTISPTATAIANVTGDSENTLTLDCIATAQTGYGARTSLSLSASASFTVNRSVTASNTLVITEAVKYVTGQPDLCMYEPFIGSTTDPNAPTPPPATLPAASELTGFRLLYPSSGSPTDELVLRAPNLGDIDRLAFNRINRETRGGTLVVFADPIWPKVETLVLQFSVLKKEEAYGLLDFMESHLGEEIRLIDWEDRAWKGVIVNPQDPIVEDRRNSFTASFEFEGERE